MVQPPEPRVFNVMSKKSTKAAIAATPLPTLSETQVQYFPLSQIRPKEGYNLRMFDPAVSEDDKSFLQTVITPGKIRTPITATVGDDGMIVIRQGHRRVAAARFAESSGAVKPFPAVPVLAAPEGSEVDATYDLFVSNNGKPLSPIEQAMGVARLRGLGESDAAIGKTIGCSTQWVKMLANMATMPDYLASAVYAEHVAGTFAAELLEASQRKEGGFDLAKVWERASTNARKAGSWDGSRYVWKVSLKHVDPVLKELGLAMSKSRRDEPVKQAAPEQAAPEQATSERAPRPGTNPPAAPAPAPAPAPASQASAKADAERSIAADRANGPGQKAAPDSAPLYAVKGETILDANGNPLATCDSEQAASRIARVLNASGERIVCAPLNGTPAKKAMTPAEKQAAEGAADRAEQAALVASGLAKTAKAVKAAESVPVKQAAPVKAAHKAAPVKQAAREAA
jgi:hypothetical protein